MNQILLLKLAWATHLSTNSTAIEQYLRSAQIVALVGHFSMTEILLLKPAWATHLSSLSFEVQLYNHLFFCVAYSF
jgi:hypothetical protein